MCMRHRVVPVDASWGLRWMSIMVGHLVALEVVVGVFMDWIMLTVLPCSLLLRALLPTFLRLVGSRPPCCLPFALALPGGIINLRYTVHLKSTVEVFKTYDI